MENQSYTRIAYVASPLRGNIEENMQKAAAYCNFTCKCKFIPYAPHLLFTHFCDDDIPEERDRAIKMAQKMMSRVDELWVFLDDYKMSEGILSEIVTAKKLNLPINYFIRKKEDLDKDSYYPIIMIDSTSKIHSRDHKNPDAESNQTPVDLISIDLSQKGNIQNDNSEGTDS